MKKLTLIMLVFVCVACCTLMLAACDTEKVVEATGITLDITSITLTEGESITLTATITPDNATDMSLDWSSSNPSVATVDSASVVAIAAGEATITATTANGKTANCVVTVVAAMVEPPMSHMVTFEPNGGTFVSGALETVAQIDDGEKLPNIAVTRGDEYVFTGWYTNENLTYKWDMENDIVNDDMTLYAGWKYLNPYQSVIDALASRIQTERNNSEAEVTVLSVFVDNGYLCFVEKDSTGVFSYQTDINGFDQVAGNAELIAQIPSANLTPLNAYNDTYTSDSNIFIADAMAGRYKLTCDSYEEIIYSCVSEWEDDGKNHYTTNGPWYSCKIKAIIANEDGKVYDCSFTVVAGTNNWNLVIGGTWMSEVFDKTVTPMGDIANDFYAERVKETEA